jgi:hypothetical protein
MLSGWTVADAYTEAVISRISGRMLSSFPPQATARIRKDRNPNTLWGCSVFIRLLKDRMKLPQMKGEPNDISHFIPAGEVRKAGKLTNIIFGLMPFI